MVCQLEKTKGLKSRLAEDDLGMLLKIGFGRFLRGPKELNIVGRLFSRQHYQPPEIGE